MIQEWNQKVSIVAKNFCFRVLCCRYGSLHDYIVSIILRIDNFKSFGSEFFSDVAYNSLFVLRVA